MYLFTFPELPDLLSVQQLSSALLCLERGPELLAKMVANMPHAFNQGELMCDSTSVYIITSYASCTHNYLYLHD